MNEIRTGNGSADWVLLEVIVRILPFMLTNGEFEQRNQYSDLF